MFDLDKPGVGETRAPKRCPTPEWCSSTERCVNRVCVPKDFPRIDDDDFRKPAVRVNDDFLKHAGRAPKSCPQKPCPSSWHKCENGACVPILIG